MSSDGETTCAWDAAHMTKLLDLQQECLRAFEQCVAELPRSGKKHA